jgi:small-conductance mechanosensitive channel
MQLDWLDWPMPYAGTLGSLLAAISGAASIYLVLMIARSLLIRRLRAQAQLTPEPLDDLLLELLERTNRAAVAVVAGLVAARWLQIPSSISSIMLNAIWLVGAAQGLLWARIIASFITLALSKILPQSTRIEHVTVIRLAIRLILYMLVLITLLANLGVDVTSILTGLGIGGVAVALSVQRVLGDFISTLTLVLDRPFVEGDVITVAEHTGKVMRIGIKTTRLKTLTGDELVVPNADLVNLRVRNLGKLEERRVVIPVWVAWETSAPELVKLPGELKTRLERLEQIRFEYAQYIGTGEAGYQLEVCYYVLTPDGSVHTQRQHEALLAIRALFAELNLRPGRASDPLPRPVSL